MRKSVIYTIVDTADNYPIYYRIDGHDEGWGLVGITDETFGRHLSFSYRVLDDFIIALTQLKEMPEYQKTNKK